MTLAALVSFASCMKEENSGISDKDNALGGDAVPFEIMAGIDTKTVNDGMATLWTSGDAVNLFHAVAGTDAYVNDNKFETEDNGETALFKGNISENLTPGKSYDWYAVYPYTEAIETPANTTAALTFGYINNQYLRQNGINSMAHICGETFPLFAAGRNLSSDSAPELVFRHLTSLAKIRVQNSSEEAFTVNTVEFTATEPIVGPVVVNFSDTENITYTTQQGAAKTIRLEVENGVIPAGGTGEFYLAFKPFTASAGGELVLKINSGAEKKFTVLSDVKFMAGKIKTLDYQYVKPFDVELAINSDLTNVVYAEPVALAGSYSATYPVDGMSAVAVKQAGESYEVVGEAQTYEKPAETFSGLAYFIDSKEMTHIRITLVSDGKTKDFYFPVGSVTGEMKGDVWMDDAVELTADKVLDTYENNPTKYPEANTGDGSTVNSFFSMHGLKVGAEIKHVLCLDELRAESGKNGSFAFINVMGNTRNVGTAGNLSSQAGFAFCSINKMDGGTMNRQCDVCNVGGKSIKDNMDAAVFMKVITSWKSADQALYANVNAVYSAVGHANTKLEKIKANYYLEQLGGIAIGTSDYARKINNFRDTPAEALRNGDFIVFKTDRNGKAWYGVMRITELPDDSDVKTAEGKADKTKIANLAGRSVKFSVKLQCEIQ